MKHINIIADFAIQLKNINMTKFILLLCDITKFIVLSIPLGLLLFITAHLLFEIKRIIK